MQFGLAAVGLRRSIVLRRSRNTRLRSGICLRSHSRQVSSRYSGDSRGGDSERAPEELERQRAYGVGYGLVSQGIVGEPVGISKAYRVRLTGVARAAGSKGLIAL
jgi:hypothetical protein